MVRSRPRQYLAILSLLLVGALCSPAVAEVRPLSDYTLKTWTRRDSPVKSPIWVIAQDKNGYLWLGTGQGLFRFDGIRFVSWNDLGLGSIPRHAVLGLLSSTDGSLWVGFGGAGVARIRDRHVDVYEGPPGLSHVRTFVEDRGVIWAGGRGGLYRFNGDAWEHQGAKVGLPEGSNNGARLDHSGTLWVRTETGIFQRSAGGPRFVTTDGEPALFAQSARLREALRRGIPGREHHLFRAVEDHDGNIWVHTVGNGVWIQRSDSEHSDPIEHIGKHNGLASDVVGAVFEDSDDNIWIGTHSGLHQLRRRTVTPLKDVGIATSILATADGSTWFGSDQGLIRLQAGRRRVYTERDGLPSRNINLIAKDPRGGLWVATYEGLVRFSNERFSEPLFQPRTGIGRITSMVADLRGTVWISDYHRGVLRWSQGKLTSPEQLQDVTGSTVSLFRAHDDRIWIGLSGGRLGVLDDEEQLFVYNDIGIAGSMSAIAEDPTGVLWIGGADGIARFDDGTSVAATSGANGFPGGNVGSIVADEPGALWVGTRNGIVRIERGEFDRIASNPGHRVRFRLYDDADGLDGMPLHLATPRAARTVDNELWFLTDSGATLVDPGASSKALRPARVFIEEIRVDGQRVTPSGALTLPARNSRLEIDFTAPSFVSPELLQIQYRLDGFDSEWQDAGGQRQATYMNLPPGDFQFQVVAVDREGRSDSSGDTLAFQIAPAFYQTSWFVTTCVTVVLAFGIGTWRLRIRQVRKRFNLVLTERARIAREIHDTLLQNFVAVALQSGTMAGQAEAAGAPALRDSLIRMRKEVEGQIREARDSIWNLRSSSVEQRGLAAALRDAGERETKQRSLRLTFAVTGQPRPCPPQIERDVLRIGQEAIRNAARHSGASDVRVVLNYDVTSVRLSVIDNGVGFDPETTDGDTHLGLIAMRERAQQAGGHVVVNSTKGHSTEVVAVVPIPAAPSP